MKLRQDKSLVVSPIFSLSTGSTRERLCLLHVGIDRPPLLCSGHRKPRFYKAG